MADLGDKSNDVSVMAVLAEIAAKYRDARGMLLLGKFTTARGVEVIGGAKQGKAIIILNPADPPILMRNTIYILLESEDVDRSAIVDSVADMVTAVQAYVPGYRLKNEPVFEVREMGEGRKTLVAMLLEVTGAGDFLPPYAGNLDIMTASARQVGEVFARHLLAQEN